MDEVWKRRLPSSLAASVEEMEAAYGCPVQVAPTSRSGASAFVDISPRVGIRIGFSGRSIAGHDLAHEVLHARRNLIERVPRLVPINRGRFASWVVIFENDLEHLTVIPAELAMFADGLPAWEERYRRLLATLDDDGEPFARRFDLLRHALVIETVFPASPVRSTLRARLERHALGDEAERFLGRMKAAGADKRRMIAASLEFFPFLRGSALIERFLPDDGRIGFVHEALLPGGSKARFNGIGRQ
jgi:hypothetical protein